MKVAILAGGLSTRCDVVRPRGFRCHPGAFSLGAGLGRSHDGRGVRAAAHQGADLDVSMFGTKVMIILIIIVVISRSSGSSSSSSSSSGSSSSSSSNSSGGSGGSGSGRSRANIIIVTNTVIAIVEWYS